jgi:hypothetical protein
MGERRSAYKILMGRPEEKRPLEDLSVDVRIILKRTKVREVGCKGVDSTDAAPDIVLWRTLVNTIINIRVPQTAGNSTDCQLHGLTYIVLTDVVL